MYNNPFFFYILNSFSKQLSYWIILILPSDLSTLVIKDGIKHSVIDNNRHNNQDICPNFGHPILPSSFQVYALCRCCTLVCYENNKLAIRKLKQFKTGSPFTIIAKLFLTCKNIYFVNDEVRAGCLKLEHTTLRIPQKKFFSQWPGH